MEIEGEREIWDLALEIFGADDLYYSISNRLANFAPTESVKFISYIGVKHVSTNALKIIRKLTPPTVLPHNLFGEGTVVIKNQMRLFFLNSVLQEIPLCALNETMLERRLALDMGL